MPNLLFHACRFIVAVALITHGQAAGQAPSVDAVRAAYGEVNRRLAGEAHGREWRAYLMLDQLSDQLRRGKGVDSEELARIHAQFVRADNFVHVPEFNAVRDALGAWLETHTTHNRLPQTAEDGLQRPTSDELMRQRAESRRIVERLHLRIPASATNDAWRDYLGISVARSQLRGDTVIDAKLFEQIAQRHAATAPIWKNLGLAETASTLNATAKMVRRAKVSDDEYRQQVKRLTDALDAYDEKATLADARSIVEILAWLDQRGQATALVSSVRPQFRKPNLFIQASRRLVGAAIDSSFDEPLRINESILGNRQIGNGRATGTVRLELTPDARRLSMQVNLASTITSNTFTEQDSVSVNSRSTASVRAGKSLLFDRDGATSHPASVQVQSSSEILDISAGGRVFGRRVAERRVYEQKGAHDEEARRLLRNRVRAEIDQQVAGLIGPVERYYLRKIRLPLLAGGQFPSPLRTWTTTGFVHLMLTQANPNQLSLASPPPPIRGDVDLSIRLHESFVANLASGVWPGATVHEETLQADLVALLGRSPEGLTVSDPQRVWTVTFDQQQPLTATFDQSAVTIELRAAGFTVGEKSYPGMWITASYELSPGAKGISARRRGRLEIVPPGFDPNSDGTLGVRQQVLRGILRKRFERIFPAEWTADSLELADVWNHAGALTMAQLAAEDGWLTVGFRMAPQTTQNVRRPAR